MSEAAVSGENSIEQTVRKIVEQYGPPFGFLSQEEVDALARAIESECVSRSNNAYRRGIIDQFYQSISKESIERFRAQMEAEGLGDPSWP